MQYNPNYNNMNTVNNIHNKISHNSNDLSVRLASMQKERGQNFRMGGRGGTISNNQNSNNDCSISSGGIDHQALLLMSVDDIDSEIRRELSKSDIKLSNVESESESDHEMDNTTRILNRIQEMKNQNKSKSKSKSKSKKESESESDSESKTKSKSKSNHQQKYESDYDSDYDSDSDSEPDFYIEPKINESNYDISQYDTEPIIFRIPEIKDDDDSQIDQVTNTDSNTNTNKNKDVESVVSSDPGIDPYAYDDSNLSFDDKWAKQVSDLSTGSDNRTLVHKIKKRKTRKAFIAGLKTKYTKFNRKITKIDENINGLNTLIAFLTVFFDKVSIILGSVVFYSKTALQYRKGDKTWKKGIGRIFTVFIMGLVFLVIFKFLL